MNGVFTMASLTFGRPLIPGREPAAVSISSLENRKAAGKRSAREWMVGHLFMVHNLSGRDEQRACAPKCDHGVPALPLVTPYKSAREHVFNVAITFCEMSPKNSSKIISAFCRCEISNAAKSRRRSDGIACTFAQPRP